MSQKPTAWWSKLVVAAAILGIFLVAHTARRRHVENETFGPASPRGGVPYNALQIAVAQDGQLVAPDSDDVTALRNEMVTRSRAARRDTPAVERHGDGTLSMVVGFDQMNFLAVRRDEDGTLTTDHLSDPGQAPPANREER